MSKQRFLVFGAAGWIGEKVMTILRARRIEAVAARSRPGDDPDSDVQGEIGLVGPTHVLCLLGRTHGPGCATIDYLEGGPDKLRLNLRDNLYAPMLLALLCRDRGIHLTYLGTGCVFSDEDPRTTRGHSESDAPNFFGSSYSVAKGFTDRLMHHFSGHVLNVRIRMPVSDEVHPRNFITKIASYERVIDVPNSVTVLPELLPLMVDMALQGQTGTVNLVNPGVVSHNEVLDLYREHVDPQHVTRNFTIEEQRRILRAGRSNCRLNTSLLETMYPEVRTAKDAVRDCIERMPKKSSSSTS